MKARINILLLFLLGIACLYQPGSQAVVIGNKTAVFIIPNSPVFPASDSDNLMLGFGHFQGGFTLEDATTSCTFNSIFPVSGTVNMNGGTLYLLQDMVLSNTTQLVGLGTIIGNNHAIDFCETITYFPSDLKLIKDVNFYFHHNIELNSTVTVQGQSLIYVRSNLITFNPGSGFVIDTNATFEIKFARLNMHNNNNLVCADDTGHLILSDVNIELDSDWIFSYGDILFQSSVGIAGPYNFAYQSLMPATVGDGATLLFDNGIKFTTGRATVGGPDPFLFYDAGSVLSLGTCTIHITASGIGLTRGTIAYNKKIIIESDSTDTACGIIVGDGISAANDLSVYFGPGCDTILQKGVITYNNVNGNKITAASPNSLFELSVGAIFNAATTCTFPQETFQADFDGITPPQIMLAPGAILYFNNTRLLIPGYGDANYHGRIQDATGFVVLDTNDSIYVSSGALLLGTRVIDSGNLIEGSGSIDSFVTLDNSASSLLVGLQGLINAPISPNGGTIRLGSNTTFAATNYFISGGTLDLQAYTLSLSPATISLVPFALTVSGDGGTVILTYDLTLSATRTIVGNVTYDGNGNAINFDGGFFEIAPSSQLTLKNITLNGIGPNSIFCFDDTGTITLENVTLSLTDDFEFAHGTLIYKNAVRLIGLHTFAYTSNIPATIADNSTLLLDGGIICVEGRATVGGPDPLYFTSKQSVLSCGQCTLHITASGMGLTRGRVEFTSSALLETESTDTNYGIILGNNSSAEDDITLYLGPGSVTTFITGAMAYNNVNSDGFLSSSPSSDFVLKLNAEMYLTTTCTFPANTFTIEYNGIQLPGLIIAPGVTLYLNNTTLAVPGYGSATYHASSQGGYIAILNSNDSIFSLNGLLLLTTQIIDSGNAMTGNGFLAGNLIFNNSTSSLLLGLQGSD